MEFTTYSLYSVNYDKIYIGYTSNIIDRFCSHNLLSEKLIMQNKKKRKPNGTAFI